METTLAVLGDNRRSAINMIHIDVTEFVERGILGPFSRSMGRRDIEAILGPSDAVSYRTFVAFGNLHFECPNGDSPPCGPRILYRHKTYGNDYDANWPDSRISWDFGRFPDGLTVAQFELMIGEGDASITEWAGDIQMEDSSVPSWRGRAFS